MVFADQAHKHIVVNAIIKPLCPDYYQAQRLCWEGFLITHLPRATVDIPKYGALWSPSDLITYHHLELVTSKILLAQYRIKHKELEGVLVTHVIYLNSVA